MVCETYGRVVGTDDVPRMSHCIIIEAIVGYEAGRVRIHVIIGEVNTRSPIHSSGERRVSTVRQNVLIRDETQVHHRL